MANWHTPKGRRRIVADAFTFGFLFGGMFGAALALVLYGN